MLNTALRTSQQRVLGTAILQWDMFSLDVCHVLQFYREVLAEPISHNNSLIILDHPWSSCIFWNHLESWHIFGNFWILLGYIGDLLEIHHQGFISYIQQICTILTFQYLTRAAFSGLQTIKVTFFILHHFPVVSPRCVSPLCLPFLSPRCVSPVCLTVFGSKSSSQPFRLSAKKEQTDGNGTDRFSRSFRHFSQVYKIEGVDSEHLEPLNSINLGVHKAS